MSTNFQKIPNPLNLDQDVYVYKVKMSVFKFVDILMSPFLKSNFYDFGKP